jgi:hypothetical protein
MTDWRDDKAWADVFRPQIEDLIRPIVGEIVELRDATEEQDRTEGFDYVIATTIGNVACRLRRWDCEYRDVTIRSYRPSGVRTEIDKLRDGHAQLYFYGWTNQTETGFVDWLVFDVPRFLAAGLLEAARDIPNPDRTRFRPIPSRELFTVPGCVLRSSRSLIPALDPPDQLSVLHSGGRR